MASIYYLYTRLTVQAFNPIERLWQHLESQAMAGYLTNDGEALTEKLLESFKGLLEKPSLIRSVCSPPNFNRQ